MAGNYELSIQLSYNHSISSVCDPSHPSLKLYTPFFFFYKQLEEHDTEPICEVELIIKKKKKCLAYD